MEPTEGESAERCIRPTRHGVATQTEDLGDVGWVVHVGRRPAPEEKRPTYGEGGCEQGQADERVSGLCEARWTCELLFASLLAVADAKHLDHRPSRESRPIWSRCR